MEHKVGAYIPGYDLWQTLGDGYNAAGDFADAYAARLYGKGSPDAVLGPLQRLGAAVGSAIPETVSLGMMGVSGAPGPEPGVDASGIGGPKPRKMNGIGEGRRLPPFRSSQPLGDQAEKAWRNWLHNGDGGVSVEPKDGTFVGGPDAVASDPNTSPWRFAELKPNNLWKIKKGGDQIRARLRDGLEGPGALYLYQQNQDGKWEFWHYGSWEMR